MLTTPVFAQEGGVADNCADEMDNDNDGFPDCQDTQCEGEAGPGGVICEFPIETLCDATIVPSAGDNDGDGFPDCEDSDCDQNDACENDDAECQDGVDNDGDNRTDCNDPGCADNDFCVAMPEDCDVSGDEDNDGEPDCQDPECENMMGPEGQTCEFPVETLCDATIMASAGDNDGDGFADCQDSDCDQNDACENDDAECQDGMDNDGDNRTDCNDPGCADNAVCEGASADFDQDGVPDIFDNCPSIFNSGQEDSNGFNDDDAGNPAATPTGAGDACEIINDLDGDGVTDSIDNCPLIPNPMQLDENGFNDEDGIGDACEGDLDSDGVPDALDNCPLTPNAGDPQADTDGDGIGDACEGDFDGDGVLDFADNCPAIANPLQEDENGFSDGDSVGDACEIGFNNDLDGDGITDSADNCFFLANPDQADEDGDGIGDVCEELKGESEGCSLISADTNVSSTNGLSNLLVMLLPLAMILSTSFLRRRKQK